MRCDRCKVQISKRMSVYRMQLKTCERPEEDDENEDAIDWWRLCEYCIEDFYTFMKNKD